MLFYEMPMSTHLVSLWMRQERLSEFSGIRKP
jgi:hypothetical protein